MESQFPLFLLLLFLSVFFISQALILPSAGKKVKHKQLIKRIHESHKHIDQESISLLRDNSLKNLSSLERWLVNFGPFENFRKKLELAGISMGFTRVIALVFLAGIAVGLLLLLFGQLWYMCVGVVVACWVAAYFYLQKKITDRLMRFEEQLPEALDIIKRVLQAGRPVNQAFGEVGREMSAPLGPEFLNTFNLLNYGYDLRLAIMQMSERTPTVSMLAFSSAVLLQKETGGNLVENIEKLSHILRARFKLARKIKTISAESRMSAWVLVLAPFALYLFISIAKPEFLEPLHNTPIGHKLIIGGMVSLFIGTLWIRKIINVEV
ncbi:type II secretion system F family protein [Vibrio diabolicus]|uniref:Type II secretion system F family protein n=1 Tax=Vibrio diabolicus TaxID=50719 RepID=A0AA92R7D9_9VIBR|nr:type II secretion system F family protein [Vibrio diabolicus]HBC3895535.1 type II secretion system F family protein [Vibrio parahaemolyticus]HDU8586860.1 type II secretion system F family protein [Vibrio alginolyticus]MCG6238236.1 type II secretion system F family protein [Vibrio diabolicus]QRG83480.1 type II secretion system F family protein [Vibrio diabolicus]HDU8576622.1 type II secretion system F family protein [Vibrio diabolicus]